MGVYVNNPYSLLIAQNKSGWSTSGTVTVVNVTKAAGTEGLENIVQSGGNWTNKVGSNSSHGYTSTRCSAIYGGYNNTKSVTATTTEGTDTLTVYNFATPRTTDLIFKVTFTRGADTGDNRQAFCNACYFNYLKREYVPDYFTYDYAVDNAARGYVNGSTPDGSSNIEGTTVFTNFVANTGYYVDYIIDSVAGNIPVGDLPSYNYSVASYANRLVTGYFGAYTYTVSSSVSGGNGAVSVTPTSGEYNTLCTGTLTPSFGYEVDHVTVNGVNVTVTNNQFTFNLTGNTTVVAYFRRKTNMKAVIGGAAKDLDVRVVIGGAAKIVEVKCVIAGAIKQ